MRHLLGAAALAMTIACTSEREAAATARITLAGAGATFPYPLYRAWFSEYAEQTGVRMNYFSVGSAEGLRLLEHGDVDFGATDRQALPATSARGAACARVAVPMVIGTIAVVYNLPSLEGAAPLRFDATLLADIFAGRVTRWNDARIAARNAGIALPGLPVTVVHRGNGSGTGQAFGAFLSTSRAWPGATMDTSDVHWPVGIAAEGNEGVAVEVKVAAGAIGYVELAYARQNRLAVGAVRGPNGFVVPGLGASDYPISARTWLVIDPARTTAERGRPLVEFVRWALRDGARQARVLEYTPISADTVARYDSLLRTFPFESCGATGRTLRRKSAALSRGASRIDIS
jgi:phosphate transport system substrate-binding protein